jgi:hypothetical protein
MDMNSTLGVPTYRCALLYMAFEFTGWVTCSSFGKAGALDFFITNAL